MSELSHAPETGLLEAGWEHLRAGRWEPARACFAEAGDSPRALEGQSWAAWWRDEADAVFITRERAFHGYRDLGDAAGAARMAIWLAADELDFHGAAGVAGGWLGRAARLLADVEPGAEHGWLAFHEGYIAHASGDTATARRLGAAAAELGRRLPLADLEMLGLALQGASQVACAELPEGIRLLDEAGVLALHCEAEIPIAGAWTCCMLVSACIAVHDFERAGEWCDRIAAFARRYGSRYMLAYCRAEYGAVALWRGRWQEADRLLAAAVEDFARSRPAWTAGPLAALAELRRRQGRAADAAKLLDRAGESTAARLCRAQLALDRGEPRAAADLLDRLLRQLPAERALDRSPALALLVAARARSGDEGAATAALAELRGVERRVASAPLRALVDRAEGVLAAVLGEHDRSRILLEDAVDRLQAAGAPYETALARIELAAVLAALGRPADARREAAEARERLRALGGTRAESLPQLTPREREVLLLLGDGLTNRQVAERLVVSEHTVHRHVTNLLSKLGVKSRAAAVAAAARAGLLDS